MRTVQAQTNEWTSCPSVCPSVQFTAVDDGNITEREKDKGKGTEHRINDAPDRKIEIHKQLKISTEVA